MDNNNEIVSISRYILWTLLVCIPYLGIVILIALACDVTENRSLTNWARANLILLPLVVLVYKFLL